MALRKACPSSRDSLPIFKLKQGGERLSKHSGLALVGLAPEKSAHASQQVFDTSIHKRSGLNVGEPLTTYVGLPCTGELDLDAIESHRYDGFFAEALEKAGRPAASALCMQLDGRAEQILPLIEQLSVNLLKKSNAPIIPLACGLVPIDIEVFTQDKGCTTGAGVSRTYDGTDGFAPNAVYLGHEGWCLAVELCKGTHSSTRETGDTSERALPRAQALSTVGLVVRWGLDFHAVSLTHQIEAESKARRIVWGGADPLSGQGQPPPHSLFDRTHDRSQEPESCTNRFLGLVRADEPTDSRYEIGSHSRGGLGVRFGKTIKPFS